MLLAPILAAGIQVTGTVTESFYTGECAAGPAMVNRPVAHRKLVVRPGAVDSTAKPVAETTTGKDGSFAFTVVGTGDLCVVLDSFGVGAVCMTTIQGASEGTLFVGLYAGTVNQPPNCPVVRGELYRELDPCGDAGVPPSPVTNRSLSVTAEPPGTYKTTGYASPRRHA